MGELFQSWHDIIPALGIPALFVCVWMLTWGDYRD